MIAVSPISSSAGASYATQLAQTSALQRNLSSLGDAVQNGNLTAAGSILTGFIKANPQYTASSTDGSQSQDPINQDFQALANAISSGQSDTARSAWAKLRNDLIQSGVNCSDGTAAMAELIDEAKASIVQQILTDTFDRFSVNSQNAVSANPLLGSAGKDSNGDVGLPTSILNNWLTYNETGNASAAAPTASTSVNTTA